MAGTKQDDQQDMEKTIKSLMKSVDDLKTSLAISQTTMAAQDMEIAKLKGSLADAKNNPVVKSQRMDSREVDIVEELARALRSVGDAKDALDDRELEVIDKPPSKEKLEALAFMEEEVIIKVHDTTDPNAVPVPPVWNDGRVQYFIRGQEQKVKRKFVERLARAKLTTFTQREEFDATGSRTFVQVPHTSLLFPFELVEDKNPKGRDWLRTVLRDPQ